MKKHFSKNTYINYIIVNPYFHILEIIRISIRISVRVFVSILQLCYTWF